MSITASSEPQTHKQDINPELYSGKFVGIKITNPNVIPALRDTLPITQEEAFRWVSDGFHAAAQRVYEEVGSPKLTIVNGWQVFSLMLPKLRQYDPVLLDI